MSPSESLAEITIQRCLEIGISEFVVCAGSRNSPLVLEVLRHDVQVWSFFEERSAAFFALGRCRDSEAPVAVITTSGTAVAELLPAVIEATYLRAPLLCITGDRPKAFRNSGAPQAIEQAGIFCMYARDSWDVQDDRFDLTRWDGWGPAHLNICFDDPLLTSGDEKSPAPGKSPTPKPLVEPASKSRHTKFPFAPDLVLLGAVRRRDRQAVREFLAELGSPILADATSCLREAPDLNALMLQSGESILSTSPPSTVLRIGGVPSCRFWRDLENLPGIQVISVLSRGFTGLARKSVMFESLRSLCFEGTPSPREILKTDRKRIAGFESLLNEFPESEPSLMRSLSERIPAKSSLFLGNSLPIREWNLAATFENRQFGVWANRGANGIDGNVSTFLGLTANAAESWGIFGDLTTLYDLAAPWILRELPAKKRRFVVINNGGGKIFSRLPVLGELPESTKRITENTHEIQLEHWAKMWGLSHRSIESNSFPARLPKEVVLEIHPDSAQTEQFWKEFKQL
tara:strand:- start:6655 stop:8202 length:1548 start_codon:yes stop_codon:yes gene_type:complete